MLCNIWLSYNVNCNILQWFCSESVKEGEKEKTKSKEGLGTFYNIPHYMKLYDSLKGAFSNYKVYYIMHISFFRNCWMVISSNNVIKWQLFNFPLSGSWCTKKLDTWLYDLGITIVQMAPPSQLIALFEIFWFQPVYRDFLSPCTR